MVLILPLCKPILYKLLDLSGHEELMVLLGLLLALVVGGAGFETLGLSSELGALAFGAMLAGHKRAGELSQSLWSLKEIFLVGFFLQIGLGGLPDQHALIFALVMTLLLPLKSALFFALFEGVPSYEVLIHRIVWSCVFLAILVSFLRRWKPITAALAHPKELGFVFGCAVFIALNWGIYIYAVETRHVLQASLGYFLTPLVNVGLGVVVLRNVLERRGELALLQAVGFRKGSLQWLVLAEHGGLLALGLVGGVVSAIVAVLPALNAPGQGMPLGLLAWMIGGILVSGLFWTWLAAMIALRGKLLPALRSE